MIVAGQDNEVKAAIKKKFEESGKFALYGTLAGAKRPLTEIAKDPETGKWTVTTFKGKDGNPVMKEVSGGDIDKNFSKLVDMYLEDVFDLGGIENKIQTVEPGEISFASREDLKAEGVLAKAAGFDVQLAQALDDVL